jgi:methionyl-tRNA formyltransferase
MTLGLLASGNLGKTILVFLIEKDYSIDFVFTDKNSIDIINICNENRIDLFIGNPRNNRCIEFIHNRKIDVLISINYLFIIEKELINLKSIQHGLITNNRRKSIGLLSIMKLSANCTY